MPSFDDFAKNPTHLTQLKQERLQKLLGSNMFSQQGGPGGGIPQPATGQARNEQLAKQNPIAFGDLAQTNPTGGGILQSSRGQKQNG